MKKDPDPIDIHIAGKADEKFARLITDEMEHSAIQRGSGTSKRSPAGIVRKMREGKAIPANIRNILPTRTHKPRKTWKPAMRNTFWN